MSAQARVAPFYGLLRGQRSRRWAATIAAAVSAKRGLPRKPRSTPPGKGASVVVQQKRGPAQYLPSGHGGHRCRFTDKSSRCPLMARSGHSNRPRECPLLGHQRTWRHAHVTPACPPVADMRPTLIRTRAAEGGAQVCTQQNEANFCISLQIIAFSCIAVSKQIEAF